MRKIKIFPLILIAFLILAPLIISINLNNNIRNFGEKTQENQNSNFTLNNGKNLKISKTWENFSFIHITGANWSIAASYDWCNGSGTLNDPYIIENITIDAGGSGSGIVIENSSAYFKIQNCEIYNSGTRPLDAGIKLVNTFNGEIINNYLHGNYMGIHLRFSDDNIILGNTANNNSLCGIFLLNSDNNTIIEGNTANNNIYGIYLDYSNNNTVSGNTANDNVVGITLYTAGNDNNISGNTANKNEYVGIFLRFGNNNTVSGNTANNNDYGIALTLSSNNTISGNTVNDNDYKGLYLLLSSYNIISGNTANYNIYGIHLDSSNNNTVSGNLLVSNVFFIEEDNCIGNIIKGDNICYTKILLSGINEFEIEPYGVDDVDVGIKLALNNKTEVIFSAYNENNIEDAPLDDGLIFMNLWLNNTNNLNQSIDAPINFTVKFDSNKYKPLKAFWFNKSANGEQGAWEELAFSDLGNGKIVISINHTSIFAIIGAIKPIPLSSSNGDDGFDDLKIYFFLILVIVICSLTIITASSTYYYKTRNKTRAKPTKEEILIKKPLIRSFDEKIIKSLNLMEHIDAKILPKILQEENGLVKVTPLGDLNKTTISPDFWEKIDLFDWNETEREVFIREILALTPRERQEIINDMLRKKNNRNLSIRSTETIYEKINLMVHIDAKILPKILQEENGLVKVTPLGDLNKTTISPDFWEKIDLFDWNETEREVFIREILALTPRERQEIINDMLRKSMKVKKK